MFNAVHKIAIILSLSLTSISYAYFARPRRQLQRYTVQLLATFCRADLRPWHSSHNMCALLKNLANRNVPSILRVEIVPDMHEFTVQ